jgi:uncharacterized membrane protein
VKQKRPVIQLNKSILDQVLDICCWIILAALWAFVVIHYKDLPDLMPIHFNVKGEVDDYGRKWLIFLFPAIATFIFAMMTIISRTPHRLNYLVKITEENAFRQYTLVVTFLRYLRLGIVLVFAVITLESVFIAMKMVHHMKAWVLPAVLAVIFIPLIVYVIRATKK